MHICRNPGDERRQHKEENTESGEGKMEGRSGQRNGWKKEKRRAGRPGKGGGDGKEGRAGNARKGVNRKEEGEKEREGGFSISVNFDFETRLSRWKASSERVQVYSGYSLGGNLVVCLFLSVWAEVLQVF